MYVCCSCIRPLVQFVLVWVHYFSNHYWQFFLEFVFLINFDFFFLLRVQ